MSLKREKNRSRSYSPPSRTNKEKQTSQPPPPKIIENNNLMTPSKTTTTNSVNAVESFVGNVASGFAFGAGSSIARNVVDRMFQNKEEVKTDNIVNKDKNKDCYLCDEYLECLKNNKEEICKQFDFCNQNN